MTLTLCFISAKPKNGGVYVFFSIKISEAYNFLFLQQELGHNGNEMAPVSR